MSTKKEKECKQTSTDVETKTSTDICKNESEGNSSRRRFFKDVAVSGAAIAATQLVSEGNSSSTAYAQRNNRRNRDGNIYFPVRNKPPVSPTLKLSSEALSQPFVQVQEGTFLDTVRQILTRTDEWENMPTASHEIFSASPAPGVVGGNETNVYTSLGFGNINIEGDSVEISTGLCIRIRCEGLDCVVHIGCRGKVECSPNIVTTCGQDHCAVNTITRVPDSGVSEGSLESSYKCVNNTCGVFDDSSQFSCDTHVTFVDTAASEIEANINHPFVQELFEFFEISNPRQFFNAVEHYIGRNLYDDSAIQ